MSLFRHILVATDFSECSDRAIELAVRMAAALDAKLTLVHAWDAPSFVYANPIAPPGDVITPLHDAAAECLNEAVARARRTRPDAAGILRRGQAWREILQTRDEIGADLIIVGTHGRSGLSHVVLGSVAEHVVRIAPVPVLTVHATGPLSRVMRGDSASAPPAV